MKRDNIEAILQRGIEFHEKGMFQEAEACYKEVLGTDPENADAIGDKDLAADLIKSAIDPTSAVFHNTLGNILKFRGELDIAVACHLEAIKLNPQYFEACFNLANLYRDLNRLEEAIPCYRLSIELEPDFAIAHINLAEVLHKLGQLEEAISCYRKHLELTPGDIYGQSRLADALFEHGVVLEGNGLKNRAISRFEEATSIYPSHIASRNKLNLLRRDSIDDIEEEPLDEDASGKRIVVVLGMHRSGTSVMSRALKVVGIDLGDNLMPAAAGNNAKGFWEDLDISRFNDELLHSVGNRWDCLVPITDQDAHQLRNQGRLLEAVKLLRKKVRNTPLFGFKDPRVAKLFPFWQEALDQCAYDTRFIIALRNPLSVAESLENRDGFLHEKSYLLWLGYILNSLIGTSGQGRILVDYDQMINSPDQELNRIAKFLDLRIDPVELDRYKSDFLEKKLRHSVYAESDLALDKKCPALVHEVYAALLATASGTSELSDEKLDELSRKWMAEYSLMKPALVLSERFHEHASNLEHTIAKRDEHINDLEHTVFERGEKIESLEHAISERDEHIAELRLNLLEQKNNSIALNQNNQVVSAQLGAIISAIAKHDFTAMLQTAQSFQQQGRLNEALAIAELIIVLQGNNQQAIDYLTQLGIFHHQRQELHLAERIYHNVLAVQNNNVSALHLLGLILSQQSKYGEAMQLVEKSIQLSKNVPLYFLKNAGQIAEKQQNPKLAEAYFKKAITANKAYVDAYLCLIPLLVSQGKFEESRQFQQELRKFLPQEEETGYRAWVKRYDKISQIDRKQIKSDIDRFAMHPKISVVMPVYNPPPLFLDEAINSVRKQTYRNWDLCIADDCSTDEEVRRLLKKHAKEDSRIRVVFRTENGHISAASNSALGLASGEFVALMDHDDIIPEHALYMVAACINACGGEVDIIYSDEDKIDQDGRRYDPYFKAQWNRYFIYSQNFVAHLGVYRKAIVDEIGGFRVGYEGSQDYDLLLRVLEKTTDDRIKHIPFVLYHWRNFRGNATFSSTQHHVSDDSANRALIEYFSRTGEKISLTPSKTVKGCWDPVFEMEPEVSVSIIIPTKDKIEILQHCIDGLIHKTRYGKFEVVIIDNNSANNETYEYYRHLENSILPFDLNIIYDKQDFNFSRLNNFAVREAKGEILVFLNNDVGMIADNWLQIMASIASRRDVGAVGAKLLYDNDTVQHTGVALGIYGIACHPFRAVPADQNVYFGYPNLLREVSAVTAACMGVKKSLFIEAGGFDEVLFPISFNDVDLSLKIQALGYKNIFAPTIRLYHYESKSRGTDDSPIKVQQHRMASKNMILKYGALLRNDPYYSPNLSLETENYDIAYPPRIAKPWRNWIEFIVPFHRGDVLLAVQVAQHAHALGVPLRLHVSEELKNLVLEFKPGFKLETVACGMPSAEETAARFNLAKNLVESRPDFSGKIAVSHVVIDFKTNGLNIVENMLRELELPIDGLLHNVRPAISSRNFAHITDKTILLHPFGGWALKSMPQHFVGNLVGYLNARGYQVVQIGGPKDEISPACNGAILENYSLADWAALFKKAAAVFCVDSWSSHFAAIMDVNHAVFYGSTHSRYTNSQRHFVDTKSVFKIIETLVDCSPCDSTVCKKFDKPYCHTFDMLELESLDEFMSKIVVHPLP